jgi:hypothetical protein
MENNFTEIDFETAHGERMSICLVGVARLENGITIEQFSVLVQIPKFIGHFTYRNFGENLVSLWLKYRIPLNYHEALIDAMACDDPFKLYLNKQ